MNNYLTNNGFTLIELLISLAISGIIMTGAYSAFNTQQGSYRVQEQVAEVQQNLRASSYIMTKEIRMAGYDGNNNTSHSSCNLNATGAAVEPGILAVTPNQLDFSMDLNSDGDCADTGENLSYYIYTSSGIDKLGRRDNTLGTPVVQAVAENFKELEFTYLDSAQAATTTLDGIRSIQVSILAEARRPDTKYTDSKTYPTTPAGTTWGPYGDNLRRRFQTVAVKCRNMGFQIMKILTKNQNGFTLVELLIALVIFAVGILGVGAMQLTSITGNSKANRVSEASALAADRIEQILSMVYMPNNSNNNGIDDDGDTLIDGADVDELRYVDVNNNGSAGLNDAPANADVGPLLSADGNYNVYWNVAVDHPIADTKTIRVIVVPTGSGSNVVMEIVKGRRI